jgi:putative membrane protein
MNFDQVLAIERPDRRLLTYYIILGCVVPPFSLVALPVLFFRYETMRYKFDAEGISMSYGILFRRQVNLTYARIQDIHLTSGIIQRWLGLADIHIQTASGSARAEMKIEGILQFEELRDFLYTKMRGYRDPHHLHAAAETALASSGAGPDTELVAVLREITSEVRLARQAIEQKQNATHQSDARA